MLKKWLTCMLAGALLLCSAPVTLAEDTEDYIPVRTVEDLYNVRNDLTAHYRLMNDIDLTEATAPGGDWDFNGNGWNPIGSNNAYGDGAFEGIFDGNGHAITGMRIEMTNDNSNYGNKAYLGLFAYNCGTIKNLHMQNCNIKQRLTLRKTYATYAGSIAGKNSGIICYCSNNSDIDIYIERKGGTFISSSVGGICGELTTSGLVSYCYNTGRIDVYTYGKESGVNTVGQSWTEYGGTAYVGGIVGQTISPSIINDCYNTGSILINAHRANNGGIAGLSYDYGIKNSYNMGNVGSAISTAKNDNCYFLSGKGTFSTGATELNESQMKNQTMFVGFDFDNTWILNPYAGYPYPQLRDNPQDLEEAVELIRIMSWPDKLDYYTGDALKLDGCIMEAVYVSGKTATVPITTDMISGYDPAKTGKQTLTVTYRDKTDTFDITVEKRPALTSMTLLSPPAKTAFAIGTTFDFTGAQVQVTYSNGKTEVLDITAAMTTGGNINHLGEQEITVTMEGHTVSFTVSVVPIRMESIEIASPPTKQQYVEGEELDPSGLVLNGLYNNGQVDTIVSGYTLSGYSSAAGTHLITVDFSGKTATFTVTVEHNWDSRYTIDRMPTCTEPGLQSIHCSWCNFIKEEKSIPPVGHQWEEAARQNATCTVDGYIDYVCSRDESHTKKEVIPATGHHYSTEWTIDLEPTCTEPGNKSHHCTICGDKTDVTEVQATGHTFGDWIIETEPTTTQEKIEIRICAVCHYKESRPVSVPPYIVGDVDNNGKVDADDALLTLQAATGKITIDEVAQTAADANGDGKVDASDALLILQFATQKITVFPTKK